jgi:hypothetical protein
LPHPVECPKNERKIKIQYHSSYSLGKKDKTGEVYGETIKDEMDKVKETTKR